MLPDACEAPLAEFSDDPVEAFVDESAMGLDAGGAVVRPTENGFARDAGDAPPPPNELEDEFASRE